MKPFVLKHPGLLALLWALIIFILCATPGRYIPSATWLDLLSFDKFVHAGIFFVLCSLLFLFNIKSAQPGNLKVLYVLLGIAYGCLLEYMQARYFSGRSADWHDIVANSLGCVLPFFFVKKFRQLYAGAR